MRIIKPNKKAKLKYNIKTNRDEGIISGKIINIEFEYTIGDFLDTSYDKLTIPMANFILRRTELVNSTNEDKKLYYGHIGLFGYYVAEDEILKWIGENKDGKNK